MMCVICKEHFFTGSWDPPEPPESCLCGEQARTWRDAIGYAGLWFILRVKIARGIFWLGNTVGERFLPGSMK